MKGRQLKYGAAELAWLKRHKTLTRRELHARFVKRFGRDDVTLENIKALCSRRKWLTGRDGRIEKGATPPNKGKKNPPGSMHPNAIATRFKKGSRPPNLKGPGHEYVCKKDGYVYLVVEGPSPYSSNTSVNSHPVMKHRYLWEQAHGPIPEGHCLKCLSGDKTNCDPSNWKLIPRAILPRLASARWGGVPYDDAPDELKPVILQTALLEHAARSVRRKAGRLTRYEQWEQRKKGKVFA